MMLTLVLVTLSAVAVTDGQYKLGKCPKVYPVPEFDMNKFLGKWYAVQKTRTYNHCLRYDFTATAQPNVYNLVEVSDRPATGEPFLDNKYYYTGQLTAPHKNESGGMIASFPKSKFPGFVSFTVFATDYDTYGAIYTCKQLGFAQCHSATILSRKKTLDETYISMIRKELSAYGINVTLLNTIDQESCMDDQSSVNEEKKNIKKMCMHRAYSTKQRRCETPKPEKIITSHSIIA